MCDHSTVKCLACGVEGSPASLLGLGKKKTMTPEAMAARKANSLSRSEKLAMKGRAETQDIVNSE